MGPKRANERVKKPTAFAFFKEQLTPAYEEKYGKPKRGKIMKSTFNAILANDFKLPGVKDIFSHLKPVQGFQLPEYTKSQLFLLELKGYNPTFARMKREPRLSKEAMARAVQPLRFNDSTACGA
jgi:hypothetical protein